MEHQFSCPKADEIKEGVASGRGERSGTGQLVATALSRTRPEERKRSPSPPTKASSASASGYPSSASVSSRNALMASLQRWRSDSPASFETIGDPIGNGSYGQVTKVRHRKSGEIFAMKAVPKQKVIEQGMQAYLMREVKTQMQLAHPCIVQLHYYFEDEHHVLLLLEYASGGSLFSLLRARGKLPEPDAARYFVDVASALTHLHKYGIVHRDLKPENILMCGDPAKAKLADFGWCAELAPNGAPRNTFCGTWDYLSPEMVQNEPHNHTVDIWAVGVLLYEMLTGRPPFAAQSQVKAMNRILRVDLQVPTFVPPLAADMMQKLLVRQPSQRIGLKDAMKHPWILLHAPSACLELTQTCELKHVVAEPRQMSKEAKELQVDSPVLQKQGSEADVGTSPASTVSVARPRGTAGSGESVSSASTAQVARPKPSVMPWSEARTPSLPKAKADSRSSSKEAITPSGDDRFGLDKKEAITPIGDGNRFGFGLDKKDKETQDSVSTPPRRPKYTPDCSPTWPGFDSFDSMRDWVGKAEVNGQDHGDALSRTHAGTPNRKMDMDPLSQSAFLSREDGRLLPQPKRKASASPPAREQGPELHVPAPGAMDESISALHDDVDLMLQRLRRHLAPVEATA